MSLRHLATENFINCLFKELDDIHEEYCSLDLYLGGWECLLFSIVEKVVKDGRARGGEYSDIENSTCRSWGWGDTKVITLRIP